MRLSATASGNGGVFEVSPISIARSSKRSRVIGRRSARKDPLIFQRDPAFQLALRLASQKTGSRRCCVIRQRSRATSKTPARAIATTRGLGAPRDHGKAKKWYLKAAQQGHTDALCARLPRLQHGDLRTILNLNINRLADRMAQQRTEPEAAEPMSVAAMQRAPTRRGRGGRWR